MGPAPCLPFVTDEKHTGYETSIWLVATPAMKIPAHDQRKHDAHPRWSPDGKRIAFAAGERKTQRQASPRAGCDSIARCGEARIVTDLPKGQPVQSGRRTASASRS